MTSPEQLLSEGNSQLQDLVADMASRLRGVPRRALMQLADEYLTKSQDKTLDDEARATYATSYIGLLVVVKKLATDGLAARN